MEAHHEVIGYVACADTGRVVDAIVALCEQAGLQRVPEAPVPVLGPAPPRDGLTMFAVLPGAPGWQVVLPLSEAFLGESPSAGGPPRFALLCAALRTPGLFREVNVGSEAASAFEAFGELTLACDGRGEFALSGYMWRASQGEGDDGKGHLQWHGHALDEARMNMMDPALAEPAFPADRSGDDQAPSYYLEAAMPSGELARRLGGPTTKAFWREGWPWSLVEEAVRLGEAMPVAGGVILGFSPAGDLPPVPMDPPGEHTADDLARRAAQGDAQAQYEVGLVHATLPAGPPYLEVREVGLRQLRAAAWFRRAAEQGHAAAQFRLGRAHYLHEGAAEDWSQALPWLLRAAAQGQREAMAWLVQPVGLDGADPRLAMMRRALGLAHDPAEVAALRARLDAAEAP